MLCYTLKLVITDDLVQQDLLAIQYMDIGYIKTNLPRIAHFGTHKSVGYIGNLAIERSVISSFQCINVVIEFCLHSRMFCLPQGLHIIGRACKVLQLPYRVVSKCCTQYLHAMLLHTGCYLTVCHLHTSCPTSTAFLSCWFSTMEVLSL